MNTDQRPKNLNLFTIRFPITAIVSILHRISGVILFFAIPILLGLLQFSLSSAENFLQIQEYSTYPLAKLFCLSIFAPFIYHFLAGMRHLLMDMNFGIELPKARFSAKLVIVLAIIFIGLAGFYIW